MLPAFIGSLVVVENAQNAITIVFDCSEINSHKNDGFKGHHKVRRQKCLKMYLSPKSPSTRAQTKPKSLIYKRWN